jgi:hypothetical protein
MLAPASETQAAAVDALEGPPEPQPCVSTLQPTWEIPAQTESMPPSSLEATESSTLTDDLDEVWEALVAEPPDLASAPPESQAASGFSPGDRLAPVIESEDEGVGFEDESLGSATQVFGIVMEPIELSLTPEASEPETAPPAPSSDVLIEGLGEALGPAPVEAVPIENPPPPGRVARHVPVLVAAFETLHPPGHEDAAELLPDPELLPKPLPKEPPAPASPAAPLPTLPPPIDAVSKGVPPLLPPPPPGRIRRRGGPPIAVLAARGPGEMVEN